MIAIVGRWKLVSLLTVTWVLMSGLAEAQVAAPPAESALPVITLPEIEKPVAERSLSELIQGANAAYIDRRFQVCLDLADAAITKEPKSHTALYLRGSARIELAAIANNATDLRTGIADVRNAIELVPGHDDDEYYLPYFYGMSHLARVEEEPEHARSALKEVKSLLDRGCSSPTFKLAMYQRALLKLQLNDLPGAKQDLRQIVTAVPKHVTAWSGLCDLLARLEQPEEALTTFAEAIAKNPDTAILYNNRAMLLQQVGRTDEALKDFEQAIAKDKTCFMAMTNMGFTLLKNGRSAEAEAAFNQSLEVRPDQPHAYSLRAAAKLDQGNAAGAVEDYEVFVATNPKNATACVDLAFAHFFAGQPAEAEANFAKALELDKTIPYLTPWRLSATQQAGQQPPAAVQLSVDKPSNQRNWFDMLTLLQLGQVDEGTILSSIHPSDPGIQDAQRCEGFFFLGLDFERQGQPEEAKARYEQALNSRAKTLSAYRGARIALSRLSK